MVVVVVDRAMRRIATRIATRNEEDFQKDLDTYLLARFQFLVQLVPVFQESQNLKIWQLKNRIKVLHHNLLVSDFLVHNFI